MRVSRNHILFVAVFLFNTLCFLLPAQSMDKNIIPTLQGLQNEIPRAQAKNMKNETGLISIFTDPPGADIYLDGNRIESSPITKEVSNGEHHIRITSSGWKEEECIVFVENDKKTIITALMLKPMPTEMTPLDIGRVHKEKLFFEDFEKEEIDYKYVKPIWIKKGKKYSLFLTGVSLVAAMIVLEGGSFKNDNNTSTKALIAGIGLGLVGTVIFFVADENSGHWVETTLEENIEYNKKEKVKIEIHNKEAREYNQKTEQLLSDEIKKRQQETEKFNEGRGLTIETI